MTHEYISREDFAAFVGEPYQGCEDDYDAYRAADDLPVVEADVDNDRYAELVEIFDDEDEWISEWLYCRTMNMPFTYTLCTAQSEIFNRIMSADEFYDFLLEIKKDKESDSENYRYR